jgi:tetratricopeptide (TPR) repeat protein
MISVVVVVTIIMSAGWIVWRRRGRWQAPTDQRRPAGVPTETLGFEAFAHGNTCLAAGKFTEAIAAFQRALELDPKRPHVANRIAEAERRQHAASSLPPVAASS